METIYRLIDFILPFEWLSYNFMKNAFISILIITPLFGLTGTMIVNNSMAFFSDALGHSALTGIALGVILGISNTNISMIIFAILFAYLLNMINSKNMVSTDTVISVFSSFSMAIGLVILSRNGNFTKYSNLLIGDILNISPNEIIYLIIIFIITLLFWYISFNKLLSISVNKSLAKSKNVNIKLIENIFTILIAIIVMLSIKWVGILIINALLILPAASSRNISINMREYHLFAILISVFSGISGLVLSYYINTATGPTIVIIASIIFFITFMFNITSVKKQNK
ncbi:MAG TPA: metal ABC transporter permease [Clostridiales bacterium]|nr:metal ABC transporter permease [Clostridiales bacterium]